MHGAAFCEAAAHGVFVVSTNGSAGSAIGYQSLTDSERAVEKRKSTIR
jgi:hypothetical protein